MGQRQSQFFVYEYHDIYGQKIEKYSLDPCIANLGLMITSPDILNPNNMANLLNTILEKDKDISTFVEIDNLLSNTLNEYEPDNSLFDDVRKALEKPSEECPNISLVSLTKLNKESSYRLMLFYYSPTIFKVKFHKSLGSKQQINCFKAVIDFGVDYS